MGTPFDGFQAFAVTRCFAEVNVMSSVQMGRYRPRRGRSGRDLCACFAAELCHARVVDILKVDKP